ncbi:hypothetical protein P154DRAFT_134506 [Amniculicola lignicola CBS 123094]|uniref:Uncharacterized protein n=1 Tax=Amniculicola lignicola CBS 123094 TaxID=1392246 RepID=A0A6A5WR51_9PLEO|nr:hypothetical protein P154DRAFT_134506 [Amniculicola lignicola CBS 123094]
MQLFNITGQYILHSPQTNLESEWLCYAANWPGGLRILLPHGLDPNSQNERGIRALHFPCHAKNAESVEILLQAGAYVRHRAWEIVRNIGSHRISQSATRALWQAYENFGNMHQSSLRFGDSVSRERDAMEKFGVNYCYGWNEEAEIGE